MRFHLVTGKCLLEAFCVYFVNYCKTHAVKYRPWNDVDQRASTFLCTVFQDQTPDC